jgi:transposase-like protein
MVQVSVKQQASRSMDRRVRPRRDFAAMQERRMHAADLFEQGVIPAEVARQVGVSHQIVSDWRAAWRRSGRDGLRGAGRAGRLPKLSRDQLCSRRTRVAQRCGSQRLWRRRRYRTPSTSPTTARSGGGAGAVPTDCVCGTARLRPGGASTLPGGIKPSARCANTRHTWRTHIGHVWPARSLRCRPLVGR